MGSKLNWFSVCNENPVSSIPDGTMQYLVFNVHKKYLMGNSFGDFCNYGRGVILLKIFQTFCKITQMVELGTNTKIPGKRNEVKSKYYLEDIPKVRIYFERLYSSMEQWVGFRIHLHVFDPQFDFGMGIEHIIKSNERESSRKGLAKYIKAVPDNEQYKYLLNKSTWGDWCDIYTMFPKCNNNRNQVNSTVINLSNIENPAYPPLVFSLERSMKIDTVDVRPLQKDISKYRILKAEGGYNYVFPFPEDVWYIDIDNFGFDFLRSMELPGNSRDLEKYNHLGVNELNKKRMENESLIERLIEFSEMRSGNGATHKVQDLDTVERDPLHRIRKKNLEMKDKIRANYGKDTKQYVDRMRKFKEDALEELVKFLIGATDQQYRVLQYTMKFFKEIMNERKNLCLDHNISSLNLTLFGNMMARKYKQIDRFAKLYNTQKVVFHLWFNRLDAFRLKKDLHNNTLLTGDADSAKSHSLHTLNKLSIPNTFWQVSRITEQAYNTNESHNMECLAFHESQLKDIGADKSGKQSLSNPEDKNRKTECETRTMCYAYDKETQKRVFKMVTTEHMNVTISCNNESTKNMPPELLERYMWMIIGKSNRIDCNRNDVIFSSRDFDDKEKEKDIQLDFQIEQLLYTIVELMIFVGIFEDVSMDIPENYVNRIFEELQNMNMIDTDQTRKRHMLFNNIRDTTICYALEALFHCELGGKYKSKTFEWKDLLDLEPYLFATEEITWFWCTMSRDNFISLTEVNVARRIVSKFNNIPESIDRISSNTKYRKMDNGTIDYRYVTVTGDEKLIALEASQGQIGQSVSMNDVVSILKSLSNRYIKSFKRKIDGSVDRKKTEKILSLIIETREEENDTTFHFAVDLLFRDSKNIVIDAIRKTTFHEFTRERANDELGITKEILIGQCYSCESENGVSIDYPNVLSTMKVSANPNNHIIHENIFYLDDTEEALLYDSLNTTSHQVNLFMRKPVHVLDMDFEELTLKKRLLKIGIDPMANSGAAFNALPEITEQLIDEIRSENKGYYSKLKTIARYPNDVVAALLKRKETIEIERNKIKKKGITTSTPKMSEVFLSNERYNCAVDATHWLYKNMDQRELTKILESYNPENKHNRENSSLNETDLEMANSMKTLKKIREKSSQYFEGIKNELTEIKTEKRENASLPVTVKKDDRKEEVKNVTKESNKRKEMPDLERTLKKIKKEADVIKKLVPKKQLILL